MLSLVGRININKVKDYQAFQAAGPHHFISLFTSTPSRCADRKGRPSIRIPRVVLCRLRGVFRL